MPSVAPHGHADPRKDRCELLNLPGLDLVGCVFWQRDCDLLRTVCDTISSDQGGLVQRAEVAREKATGHWRRTRAQKRSRWSSSTDLNPDCFLTSFIRSGCSSSTMLSRSLAPHAGNRARPAELHPLSGKIDRAQSGMSERWSAVPTVLRRRAAGDCSTYQIAGHCERQHPEHRHEVSHLLALDWHERAQAMQGGAQDDDEEQ